MSFEDKIIRLLKSAGVEQPQLEVPPNLSMGHFAFPTFPLAKERKKSPAVIAQELASQISSDPAAAFLEKTIATGPYLNFFIKSDALISASFEDPGFPPLSKLVVIDYSAPNIAKPFGIGHLRSTVIGGALKRIYHYAGWKTFGINHLGDWGTQFGKLIAAYRRWPTDLTHDPIKKLLDLYVRFHAEAEHDPALENEGREEFRKLEEGDPENVKLWQQFSELSLQEFNKLYAKLGVSFDIYTGEAFYIRNKELMQIVVDELRDKTLLEESDGAQIVRLDDLGIDTPAIILKRDGATIYMTRDLATIFYRKKMYNFDRILYEVGTEQTLHFRQLFGIVRKMGHPWYTQCFHVSHGLYMFEDGKMSTRKGKVIFIEDVLQKAIDICLRTIEEKNPELRSKKEVAEQVGIGAIIFYDLKNDRTKDIIFNWNEILDFEGETGPYLQYTHARLRSIIRKSNIAPKLDVTLLTTEEDMQVAQQLRSFKEVIDQVVQNNKPHILARYLLDLAQIFNSYYQKHRIIQENKALEAARLALVQKVADRLKMGLSLLGIEAPEEM